MKSSLILAALLIGSATSSAQAFDAAAELAYSRLSIDYKPLPDAEGLRTLVHFGLGDRFTLSASYNDADFRPSGPELGRYAEAANWADVTAGLNLWRHPAFAVGVALSSQSVELDEQREYGYAAHAQLAYTPWSFLRLDLDLAHMDLVIEDVRAAATLSLRFTPVLALTARIIDHSDWDLTFYEAGLRWQFAGAQ